MSRTRGGSPTRSTRSVDSFLEAKLTPPPSREEWVDRTRLLDLLDRAMARPMVLVAAPAGFGKTTLVAQWLTHRRRARGAAWVSLDAGDNDPVRLWTHVATALQRAGCPLGSEAADLVAATSSDITATLLPRLVNALAEAPEETVILLDDFHFVHSSVCHDQVEFLVEHLPARAHLLITTRFDPGLRIGRLRASGRLGEIRSSDLAFNAEEATSLLAHDQVRLSSDSIGQLLLRTEGWAAGLYLATLSLVGRTDPDDFVRQFSGDNRFIGDYMTEEVLSRHTPEVREFITTTSILDRLSAPLCDYVAETTDSAAVLHELERTNMFLVSLDEHRTWFRFHQLFASAARNELELAHPDRVVSLHRRAAAWFQDHGHVDEAITHLLAAGSTSDVAVLVQANWLKYVSAGRTATVIGWLDALGPPSIARDPAAGVAAAWMAGMIGDQAGLVAHVAALQEFTDYGPLPDGSRSVESAIAMIHGLFGFGGPVEMAAGAQRAVELETDGRSPYFALATFTLGHAAYIAGDLDRADTLLASSAHNEAAMPMNRLLALSIHSLVEAEAGHDDRALELAGQAMALVEAGALHAVPQATVAFTAHALAMATAGNLEEATASVEHALSVRRRNPGLAPWATMHHLLVGAHVALLAGNVPWARELLEENRKVMDRFPEGMGRMRARHAAIRDAIPSHRTASTDEPLTEREVEVLRLLQGSLSLAEIAGQLYVSHNTVKTHTRALYRKLGATSRSEAVRIARERLLV